MDPIKIDADALYRAVTASGFKLLAFNLNLKTGEIVSRTMRPDEVTSAPQGPSVRPLPKMGGELTPRKEANLFGPTEPEAQPKKKLFNDDDGPKKPAFGGDFFKRDDKKKVDPFGDDGFKRQSGAKKLAEMFSEPTKKSPPPSPFDKAPAPTAPSATTSSAPPTAPSKEEEEVGPRIPAMSDAQILEFMMAFAKDYGDPEIRDEMGAAVKAGSPQAAWTRVMRKYARANQQWENYYRKQALYWAETWLSDLGIAWELIENEKPA
jgi:hypothetical protein